MNAEDPNSIMFHLASWGTLVEKFQLTWHLYSRLDYMWMDELFIYVVVDTLHTIATVAAEIKFPQRNEKVAPL